MVATSINATRRVEALSRVRDLVEEHGTVEQQERLNRIMGGPVPAPNRLPIEHAVYTSEALAILFEIVLKQGEALRDLTARTRSAQATPKRRGRKPNVEFHEES